MSAPAGIYICIYSDSKCNRLQLKKIKKKIIIIIMQSVCDYYYKNICCF